MSWMRVTLVKVTARLARSAGEWEETVSSTPSLYLPRPSHDPRLSSITYTISCALGEPRHRKLHDYFPFPAALNHDQESLWASIRVSVQRAAAA